MLLRKNCTAVLVGKEASSVNSPIYCHLEDNGLDDAVVLVYYPKMEHSEKILKLSNVVVDQVERTFAHWAVVLAQGTPMSKEAFLEAPSSPWVLCGMNEYGVSIGAHGVLAKQELIKGKGLSFFEVNKLVLERAKNAEEAVQIIGHLVEEYGQMGMGTNNAYCIGAPDGCWIVEVSAKNWAAKKCPDDGIIAYANQYIIESDWDFASKDLINYAKQRSWYETSSQGKFSFRRSYGKDLDLPYNTLREQRIKELLSGKLGKISVQDIMEVTRDHYESSEYSTYATIDKITSKEPYSYPPHKSPYRTICVPRTQASMVCVHRDYMPREIGNLMWLCMSSPCTSVYLPIYAGSSRVPKEYQTGGGQYNPESAWWIFEQLQRLVDDYWIDRDHVKKIWAEFEEKEFEHQKHFEDLIVKIYEQNPNLAKELLSECTIHYMNAALQVAKVLISKKEIINL